MRAEKVKIIAFEGIDRAGKSTLVENLSKKLKTQINVLSSGELRSPIADKIREMLKSGASPWTKTFMFAADRAWKFEHDYINIQAGSLLLWDRYVASAIAYRSAEIALGHNNDMGLTNELVRSINSAFPQPELTIYLDVTVSTSVARAQAKKKHAPYGPDVLERVRLEYKQLGHTLGDRFVSVDAEQPADVVESEVMSLLLARYPELHT